MLLKGATRSSRVAARSKSVVAYEVVRQRIEDGIYPPGFHLVLDHLAKELAVSPLPIREAFRRLEAEGLIVFELHAGAHVASIGVTEHGQLIEVYAALEGLATSLAAPFLGSEGVQAARAVNNELRAMLSTWDEAEFTRLNRQFHEMICAPCPNGVLKEIVTRERVRMVAGQSPSFQYAMDRVREAVDEHEKLLELITTEAPATTVELFCRRHRMGTARYLADR